MIYNILQNLLFILIIFGVIKFTYNLCINEYFVHQITNNFKHNRNLSEQYGLTLHRISLFDCAPCEVKFEFRLEEKAVFNLYGRKAARLLRKMERCQSITSDIKKSLKHQRRCDNIGNFIKTTFNKIALGS